MFPSDIPKDIWNYIFQFLDLDDIYATCISCKYFYNIQLDFNTVVCRNINKKFLYIINKINSAKSIEFIGIDFDNISLPYLRTTVSSIKFVKCYGILVHLKSNIKHYEFINCKFTIDNIGAIVRNAEYIVVCAASWINKERAINIVTSIIFDIKFKRKFEINTWCKRLDKISVCNIFSSIRSKHKYDIKVAPTDDSYDNKHHLVQFVIKN